jgi:predicted dehydrogenase
MMGQPLRFGLVGAGGIAQAYVQVLADLDEASVVGVADTRKEAADAAAATLDCKSYADVEALASGNQLDGVILCTPPATHVALAEYFVRLGVPVLCEKPFAVTPGEARRLIAVADAASVTVTMAAKFRYVDDVHRARDIVESGMLGDPILFENTFASRVAMADRWNANPQVSGGGVLIDNGTHSVDIARFFLGRISEVHAVEGRREQGLEVEDTAQMFLRTEQDVLGTVDLSWSIDKSVDHFVRICCSEGVIEVGWRASRSRKAGATEWTVFGPGYDKVAAMRAEILNFARSLNGSEKLLITADDAIASVDVIAAAYRSITRRQWVTVASPPVRVLGSVSASSGAAADVA